MPSQDYESLRDLDGVKVVVEELGAQARARRLAREDVQKLVEGRLRDAGIKVLTSGHFPPGDPLLRIDIRVTAEQKGLVAYRVSIDFAQLAFLRRNPSFPYNRAQTWKSPEAMDMVNASQLAAVVRREVTRQTDEFAAAYLAVNPRA